MYEIEVKYRIGAPAALEAKLAALGCVPGPACEEIDRFFRHPARDFAETDECLRMRRRIFADGRIEQSVTYKGPKTDTKTKTRREIELPVAAPADHSAPSWVDLFEALGFREAAMVRKFRRYGELAVGGERVEILLDYLPDLDQYFIELEVLAEKDASSALVSKKQRLILDLTETLELGEPVRASYLEAILHARISASS